MQKVNIKKIIEITDERIDYYDEQGKTAFIELSSCALNYAAAHNKTNQDTNNCHCVGERFFGDYAYYEFFTEEHIQFYIKISPVKCFISKAFDLNLCAKEHRSFHSVQMELNAHGWTTLDLS